MSIQAGFLYLIIAAIPLFAGIGIVLAIGRNFQKGMALRDAWRERIRLLRFGKMLRRRGLVLEEYLHGVSAHEIEKQIRNCESCAHTKECDTLLADTAPVQPEATSFCPNDGEFTKHIGHVNN